VLRQEVVAKTDVLRKEKGGDYEKDSSKEGEQERSPYTTSLFPIKAEKEGPRPNSLVQGGRIKGSKDVWEEGRVGHRNLAGFDAFWGRSITRKEELKGRAEKSL